MLRPVQALCSSLPVATRRLHGRATPWPPQRELADGISAGNSLQGLLSVPTQPRPAFSSMPKKCLSAITETSLCCTGHYPRWHHHRLQSENLLFWVFKRYVLVAAALIACSSLLPSGCNTVAFPQVHISHVGTALFKGITGPQVVMQLSSGQLACRMFPENLPSTKADMVRVLRQALFHPQQAWDRCNA